jgi:hypothetical protein
MENPTVTRLRIALLALAPVLAHALAREVDRGLGLVLRAEVEPDGLLAEVARAVAADGADAAGRVALWLLAGAVLQVGLAAWRRRECSGTWPAAPGRAVLLPLLLRPAITLLALASVAVHPSYPYGLTLPVALTQDWGIGQDAAVLAAMAALRPPAHRLPAPRAGEVFFVAFLAYAVLVPGWAWRWESHPGNEPKYLRQAVALGHWLTFDAEGVSAAMEELPTRPLSESVPAALGTIGRESWGMAVALARGEAGREAIRATRIVRQTVRGKNGGVYYVLAPGPSLMLAPTLRVDRAINRARGEPGRVAVSVLLWCALAALLVAALFLLVRDATGRPGLAALLAFGFALVPPFLFYSFQFYPEMVGALVLAVAFRTLALRPHGLLRRPWPFGSMLATLPWLHQKFLPVWLVLVATAAWVALRPSYRGAPRASFRGAPSRPGEEASAGSAGPSGPGEPKPLRRTGWAVGLLVPTAASLCLTALYNFAITGSVRPDALFLAWGPGGVTSARVGQGVLGLLLDARYGILPYVPVLLPAAGGLVLGGARRFAVVLPAAVVYYLTVASADNWAGAVCNLGRYFMPVAPLAVALVGTTLAALVGMASSRRGAAGVSGDEGSAEAATVAGPSGPGSTGAPRDGARRGVATLALMLAAWTGLLAVALWRDPHAANDCGLLLAKSTYADANQYVPNLFIRRWSDGAPGLWARIFVWLAVLGAVAWWLRRVAATPPGARGARGDSPLATLAAVATVVLAAGLFLERWPGKRGGPVFPGAIVMGTTASRDGTTRSLAEPPVLFASGAAGVREDETVLGPGRVDLLVRSSMPFPSLPATVGGQGGVLRADGLPPFLLRPTGASVELPLFPYHEVRGRDGRTVAYSRTTLEFEGEAVLRPGVPPTVTEPGAAGER